MPKSNGQRTKRPTKEQLEKRRSQVDELRLAGVGPSEISTTISTPLSTVNRDLAALRANDVERWKTDKQTLNKHRAKILSQLTLVLNKAYLDHTKTVDPKAKVGFLRVVLEAIRRQCEILGLSRIIFEGEIHHKHEDLREMSEEQLRREAERLVKEIDSVFKGGATEGDPSRALPPAKEHNPAS